MKMTPGQTVKDSIKKLGMNQKEFADLIMKATSEVSDIIRDKKPINTDFAIRFGIVFNTSAMFRLEMYHSYKIRKEWLKRGKEYRSINKRLLKRKCRVCGCTQNNACSGGCLWVGIDLCSACIDAI